MARYLVLRWADLIDFVTKAMLLLSFVVLAFAEVMLAWYVAHFDFYRVVGYCIVVFAMVRLNRALNGR